MELSTLLKTLVHLCILYTFVYDEHRCAFLGLVGTSFNFWIVIKLPENCGCALLFRLPSLNIYRI